MGDYAASSGTTGYDYTVQFDDETPPLVQNGAAMASRGEVRRIS